MKTQLIHKLFALLFLMSLFSFTFSQTDEDPEKVIFTLKGKKRTEKLQVANSIILPRGQITSFEYSFLDTTRYYWNQKKITDPKQIKELINLLEKGTISDKSYAMLTGVGLSINYKDYYTCDILASENNTLFWDYDTSVVLINLDPFIEKLQDMADWKPFDPAKLKNAEKIDLSYKKNKKTITDPILINELLACMKSSKPTYSTKCPFYNSRIYIHIGDKVISAAPAHDGCSVIIIEKNYFEMDRTKHKKFIELLNKYVSFEIGP